MRLCDVIWKMTLEPVGSCKQLQIAKLTLCFGLCRPYFPFISPPPKIKIKLKIPTLLTKSVSTIEKAQRIQISRLHPQSVTKIWLANERFVIFLMPKLQNDLEYKRSVISLNFLSLSLKFFKLGKTERSASWREKLQSWPISMFDTSF